MIDCVPFVKNLSFNVQRTTYGDKCSSTPSFFMQSRVSKWPPSQAQTSTQRTIHCKSTLVLLLSSKFTIETIVKQLTRNRFRMDNSLVDVSSSLSTFYSKYPATINSHDATGYHLQWKNIHTSNHLPISASSGWVTIFTLFSRKALSCPSNFSLSSHPYYLPFKRSTSQDWFTRLWHRDKFFISPSDTLPKCYFHLKKRRWQKTSSQTWWSIFDYLMMIVWFPLTVGHSPSPLKLRHCFLVKWEMQTPSKRGSIWCNNTFHMICDNCWSSYSALDTLPSSYLACCRAYLLRVYFSIKKSYAVDVASVLQNTKQITD